MRSMDKEAVPSVLVSMLGTCVSTCGAHLSLIMTRKDKRCSFFAIGFDFKRNAKLVLNRHNPYYMFYHGLRTQILPIEIWVMP